jgi:pimeloyl-ACP methyl ester carboxylesterase
VDPLKRAFLDTPDGQIHYRMDGKGEPPLVLLHGTPRSSFEYHKVIPILAQKRRVIAMDTIGYGDSDKLPESKWYTIEDYAGTVIKLLDSLRIEKAVIVGCHSGSKMAIEVAAAYPERPDKLVLLGPYFWEEAKWWTDRGLLLADMWKEPELKEDGSHLVDLWHQRALGMELTDLKIKQRLFLDILRAEGMSHRGHWASASYAQEKRLPLIKCPTLVIWGSEDIRLHSEIGFHRRNLAESIPRCKVAEIQGGAFTIALQMPEEVSRTILEFLGDSNGE